MDQFNRNCFILEIHEYEVEEAIARKRRKTLDANFLEAIKGAQNISQDDPKLIEVSHCYRTE